MASWLIQYMKNNKYKVDEGGICNGIANMAKQAILLDQLEIFMKRLKLIENKYNSGIKLEELDLLEKLDIVAFLDGVQLYQSPDELFENKAGCQQDKAKEVFDIIKPLKFQEKQQSREEEGIYDADDWYTHSFSGCYTIEELTKYLHVLEEIITNCFLDYNDVPNVCFKLTANCHAVILNYNNKDKFWRIINSNDFEAGVSLAIVVAEAYKTAQKFNKNQTLLVIAKNLFNLFNITGIKEINDNEQNKLIMLTEMCVFNQSLMSFNNMIEFINKLNNNDIWKKLHAITEDKLLKDSFGNCWLQTAIIFNDEVIIPNLIQAGANVNQTDRRGYFPLLMAASLNRVHIVKLLIKNGANINQVNNANNISAIWIAAQNGHAEIVELLIKANAAIDQSSNKGVSSLFIAASSGHAEIVQLLIEAKANVNQCDDEGVSPLWVAAENGHAEIVKLLIKHADITILKQAKSILSNTKSTEILNIINKAITEALFKEVSSKNCNNEVVKLLVEANVKNIHAVDDNGNTALSIAAQNGNFMAAYLLIKNKIDVNTKNNQGETSLIIAKQNGHIAIANLLQNHIKNQKAKAAVLLRPMLSNQQSTVVCEDSGKDNENYPKLSKTL